jgi:hypothetical protein
MASAVPADAMWAADVAKQAGVAEVSVKNYHNQAQASRERVRKAEAAGIPLDQVAGRLPGPRDMPVPDGWGYPPDRSTGSVSPWWLPATIAQWLAIRQGPGKPRRDGTAPQPRKPRRAKPGPKPRRDTPARTARTT